MLIEQRRHILPYLVGQGLETKHDMASSLFLCRFPDLNIACILQNEPQYTYFWLSKPQMVYLKFNFSPIYSKLPINNCLLAMIS